MRNHSQLLMTLSALTGYPSSLQLGVATQSIHLTENHLNVHHSGFTLQKPGLKMPYLWR